MKLERYITPEYLKSQQWLHAQPKGYGGRGDKWKNVITDLVVNYQCGSMIDYGCGQATLHAALTKFQKRTGLQIHDYDPAIKGMNFIPDFTTYDLVVCTDVLEHVEPDRLAVVVNHLFKLANKLVFAVIATRPSKKFFKDGSNVHLTIEPESWWRERVIHPGFKLLDPPPSPMQELSREWIALFQRK